MSVTGIFTVCDQMDVSRCAVVVLTTPLPGPVLGGKALLLLGGMGGWQSTGEQGGRGGRQGQAGRRELKVKSVVEKFEGTRQRKKYTC